MRSRRAAPAPFAPSTSTESVCTSDRGVYPRVKLTCLSALWSGIQNANVGCERRLCQEVFTWLSLSFLAVQCNSCPALSSTNGATGSTSATSCQCESRVAASGVRADAPLFSVLLPRRGGQPRRCRLGVHALSAGLVQGNFVFSPSLRTVKHSLPQTWRDGVLRLVFCRQGTWGGTPAVVRPATAHVEYLALGLGVDSSLTVRLASRRFARSLFFSARAAAPTPTPPSLVPQQRAAASVSSPSLRSDTLASFH